LKQQGAIGDIAGHIFNMAGQLQPCAYNERLIGITLAELGQIATTIAVAVGREKGRAMLGALRTGVIDVLCTDDRAAEEILRLHS